MEALRTSRQLQINNAAFNQYIPTRIPAHRPRCLETNICLSVYGNITARRVIMVIPAAYFCSLDSMTPHVTYIHLIHLLYTHTQLQGSALGASDRIFISAWERDKTRDLAAGEGNNTFLHFSDMAIRPEW